MTKVYSTFKNIYSGPHLTPEGLLDDRVYFYLPLQIESDGSYSYLVFPYGATPSEIKEITQDPRLI